MEGGQLPPLIGVEKRQFWKYARHKSLIMIYFIYFDSLFSLFTCGNYPESPCVSESARLYIGSIYAIEIDINNGFSRKATMTQQTASRTTTFAFTNYLSRLPWLIAALGMVPATLAQLPSVVVGANVETSNVCPSCTHYIKTNRGDLFDLAKLAGGIRSVSPSSRHGVRMKWIYLIQLRIGLTCLVDPYLQICI
jgi:hypothetical protein